MRYIFYLSKQTIRYFYAITVFLVGTSELFPAVISLNQIQDTFAHIYEPLAISHYTYAFPQEMSNLVIVLQVAKNLTSSQGFLYSSCFAYAVNCSVVKLYVIVHYII